MPTFPYSITLTLLRRAVTGKDEYGNDVWTATPEDIPYCVIQPTSSTENVQWTDQVTTSIVIFMPYGTVVGPYDYIMVNGVKYEINGQPEVWYSPFSGNTSPVRINASVVTGASV